MLGRVLVHFGSEVVSPIEVLRTRPLPDTDGQRKLVDYQQRVSTQRIGFQGVPGSQRVGDVTEVRTMRELETDRGFSPKRPIGLRPSPVSKLSGKAKRLLSPPLGKMMVTI